MKITDNNRLRIFRKGHMDSLVGMAILTMLTTLGFGLLLKANPEVGRWFTSGNFLFVSLKVAITFAATLIIVIIGGILLGFFMRRL